MWLLIVPAISSEFRAKSKAVEGDRPNSTPPSLSHKKYKIN